MIQTHVLGYPRIGAQRELKFALEQYWRGEISAHSLEVVGQDLRRRHWQCQHDTGLGHVTVGDFAFYDHVANHIQLFSCEPARFGFDGNEPPLERYFVMARGVADEVSAPCCDKHDGAAGGCQPLEMTKWFDTNYHYLVPEFLPDTDFRLNAERLLDEVAEARSLGHAVKVVMLGPLSFLWLGKEKSDFNRLDLLQRLLPAYGQMLNLLKQAGVDWIQLDEPILGLDLPAAWRAAFEPAYSVLAASGARILLASYFSPLADNIGLACRLPVAGLHVDAVRAPEDLAPVVDWLPAHKLLSVGIVDGRNVWRTDLDRALQTLKPVVKQRTGAVWIAPSCSLLHVPVSLAAEVDNVGLSDEVQRWLAFADEKLAELDILRRALVEGETAVAAELAEARDAVAQRQASPRVRNTVVAQRVDSLPEDVDRRASPFPARRALQRQRLALPWFPTTTIGSFPQTRDIRQTRAAFRKGNIGATAYREFMREAIADAIRRQEALGLDVLVHGEAERNDMVEYFGERLAGFAFTANGWVQSYGSRCVKPPVLYGDVHRPQAMTVEWSTYAASLTERPVKGMLTGPITILQWSFVRDDQSRAETAQQIALAIRDEVADLQSAGIAVIQIDEPALREGLPLRRSGWQSYLNWACRAFRIAASAARDDTQVHTHMCYSEFNDILSSIAALDADVITIETSRSDMELLRGFGDFRYPNEIGPGVYDIHSPRVPEVAEMAALLEKAARVIDPEQLWVNPDCGLKTRGWPETEAALANMVTAARRLRARFEQREMTEAHA